jgi:hypothetical protein
LLEAIQRILINGSFGLTEQDVETVSSELPFNNRYIDVQPACTIIGAKLNLDVETVAHESEQQLARSLGIRGYQTGQRYVGVLTNGIRWDAYQLLQGNLQRVTIHNVNANRPDGRALFYWLDGVLATRRGIPATAAEIEQRLGATSASHAIDFATLSLSA